MFKTSLLQLTGLLEKKLEALRIITAEYDFEYRYKLIANKNSISANLASFNDVIDCIIHSPYNSFLNNKILNQFKFNNGKIILFSNLIYIEKSYDIITELFDNSVICNSIYSREYSYYKIFFENECNKTIFEEVYKQAYKRRHNIAHNLEVLYSTNRFDIISNYNEKTDNIFAQFQSLIYVDQQDCNTLENTFQNSYCHILIF